MPDTHAADSLTESRRQEAVGPNLLYAVDASITRPVPGIGELTELACSAVRAGGGHVLDSARAEFPNGALTLVLILAESHLAIHTWPERDLIAIDLFSCGAIDGRAVVDELTASLRLTEVSLREIPRTTRSAHRAVPGR